KKVGDTVQIEAEELPIVGIVDGQAVVENGSIILSLDVLQEATANEGKITFIFWLLPKSFPRKSIG
ncbi:MAG: hypothetical protein ACEQSB_05905, partial [Undibacterium sp.]